MDYPEVLGASIKIMPPKKRSLDWFQQQPDPIRRQFWHTLTKFSPVVAAEYLRSYCVEVPDLVPVSAVVRAKELNTKILKAFSKPLEVSGTVIGQMWPTGLRILLPTPQYYSYNKLAPNWTHIGVATTCKGDRVTRVSNSAYLACEKTRQSARRFARAGHPIGHIKVELFEIRLEQVEMIGKTRKCA